MNQLSPKTIRGLKIGIPIFIVFIIGSVFLGLWLSCTFPKCDKKSPEPSDYYAVISAPPLSPARAIDNKYESVAGMINQKN